MDDFVKNMLEQVKNNEFDLMSGPTDERGSYDWIAYDPDSKRAIRGKGDIWYGADMSWAAEVSLEEVRRLLD